MILQTGCNKRKLHHVDMNEDKLSNISMLGWNVCNLCNEIVEFDAAGFDLKIYWTSLCAVLSISGSVYYVPRYYRNKRILRVNTVFS